MSFKSFSLTAFRLLMQGASVIKERSKPLWLCDLTLPINAKQLLRPGHHPSLHEPGHTLCHIFALG